MWQSSGPIVRYAGARDLGHDTVRDREVIKSREGHQVGATNLGYELNKLLFFILLCLK